MLNIPNRVERASPVIRISFPWMIEVVASLDQIDKVEPGQTIGVAFPPLLNCQNRLRGAYAESIYWPYLRTSRENAEKLNAAIEGVLEPFDLEKVLGEYDVWRIKNERDEFRTVFRADISQLPAYLVSKKENYDVDYLIDNGVGLFPSGLLSKAPETKADAMEVGLCLAYERYTACGFHTFRVLESVVRRYWDAVAGGKARPVPETLGTLAGQMKICGLGDAKVYESIEMLTKLHRNPLAHPDVILNKDEAIGAVGMARSVITPMLSVLPDIPPTTGAPAAQIAP